MKSLLKDSSSFFSLFVLGAFAFSGFHPLSGELLDQSLLRGRWLVENGLFPRTETLSVIQQGRIWNPALAFSDIITGELFFLIGERGLLIATALSLLIATIFIYLSLNRICKNPSLSFLLALLASLALWIGISDFGTALGAAFCGLELLLYLNGRWRLMLLIAFFHIFIDLSAPIVPLLIFPLEKFSRRLSNQAFIIGPIFGLLLLFLFGVELSSERSAFTDGIAQIFTGLLLILVFPSIKTGGSWLGATIATIILSLIWQRYFQFPASVLIAPILAASIWDQSESPVKNRCRVALEKLSAGMRNFLTLKNRMGVIWLSGAFIFFQLSLALSHPVKSALLPANLVDHLVQQPLKQAPVHSTDIGGSLGNRLDFVLPKDTPRNFIGPGTFRLNELIAARNYQHQIALGEDPATDYVLCRKKEGLCQKLLNTSGWIIEGKTELSERVKKKLDGLPPERANRYREVLEQDTFYLLHRTS